MHEEIERRLSTLDGQFASIRDVARRFLDETAVVDPASGAALVSHRPKVAPQAFAVVLYAGVSTESITLYEGIPGRRGAFHIPAVYKSLLALLNGAHLFEIDLYGVPLSMTYSPPLLNRSVRQPLDLATANFDWSRRYQPDPDQFHFGSGPYSYEENIGYFLNPDEGVEARRVGGERFGYWKSLATFLAEELRRAEDLFPFFEERQFRFRQLLEETQQDPKKSG